MSVPSGLPWPLSNQNRTGFLGVADDITGTDIVVAAGDYTGGTPEDEFNLTAHGMIAGEYLHLLYKSAAGVVTGLVGLPCKVGGTVSANSFQITNLAGTVIENTADGTAVFLRGELPTSVVQNVILPRLIVANGDFTSGVAEDMFTPTMETGYHFLEEEQPLKLLYKAAAGVLTGISAGTTVYAKSVTTAKFELAATAGGADIENTADGLAVFLKAAG